MLLAHDQAVVLCGINGLRALYKLWCLVRPVTATRCGDGWVAARSQRSFTSCGSEWASANVQSIFYWHVRQRHRPRALPQMPIQRHIKRHRLRVELQEIRLYFFH